MAVNQDLPNRDPDHTGAAPVARRTQAERSAATREALIEAATELFAEQGFVETAREEICARAGVTRGALDHHFDGKRGLFRAVAEAVEIHLNERIAEAAFQETDPLRAVKAGCHKYLDTATEPAVRRILLLDSRAVLGWKEWQEFHAEHGLKLMVEGIRGVLPPDRQGSVEPVAHIVLAALTEAALYVATSDNPDAARAEVQETTDRIIDSLMA